MEVDNTMRPSDSGAMMESPVFKMAIRAVDLECTERWRRQRHAVFQARARWCDDVPALERIMLSTKLVREVRHRLVYINNWVLYERSHSETKKPKRLCRL